MVEPVSLSLGVVVAGFLTKAFEGAGGKVGGAVAEGLGRLLGAVRERLGGDAGTALARAEEAPDSPSRLRALAGAVDAEVARDAGFGTELEELVAALERAGLPRESVVQQAWGDGNVQIAGVQGSSIDIQR